MRLSNHNLMSQGMDDTIKSTDTRKSWIRFTFKIEKNKLRQL